LGFWLDKAVRRSRIPYSIFFTLMGLFLYVLGIPFMIASNNLQRFLSEPRWIIVAAFGSLNGILIIFVLREFSDSLLGIRQLIDDDDFQMKNDRLLGYLTSRVYWLFVVFWLALNLIESPRVMRWWWSYDQTYIVTAYQLVETLPCCILGGIFMYMIPVGLSLAYRDLCLKTPFKKDLFLLEWIKSFKGFRRLISLTMFGSVAYAVFPPIIWGSTAYSASAAPWSHFIPYTGIAIVFVSAVLFPHYFFHELFSNAKDRRLDELGKEITQTSLGDDKSILRKILLLFERGEVEKLETWLIDIKILGEVLVVALMHIILVEALTFLLRG